MSMATASETSAQQRSKILWLWIPTAVLMCLGLALTKFDSGWSLPVLGLATLWAALGTIGFSTLEGMRFTGSGMMGYGPDIRAVGVFSHYRDRRMLLATIATYVALLMAGIVLPERFEDPMLGSVMLQGLQFVVALLPLELASFVAARRWGDWPPMRKVVALWLPAAGVGLLAHFLLVDLISVLRPALVFPASWWVGPVTIAAYLSLLISLHHQALRWQYRLDQAHNRADEADTARRLAEARLAVLQAQIEPHFLYNTLATVQYLLKGEPDAADFLLTQLIRYLRLAMPSMRQFSSTLGREFELTDAYLQIARLRMGGRLSVDLDLATALEGIEFPPLVLQTLVENAIKHGVEPKTGPVRIRVFVQRGDSDLRVCVQDDGVGLGGAATQGGGTGLQNIRERLQSIYGDQARLQIAGLPQGGVMASVTLPLDKERIQ
ncbi:hypothetical protein AT984_16390 [Paucibacter sp. KCTC 42545]|nr:hypothetical protein AT984_16390 [Paucibacter sp. KCTC 42545]